MTHCGRRELNGHASVLTHRLAPTTYARSERTILADARVERRLAAILAAGVAGYSRLMGATTKDTELDAAR